MTMSTDLLSSSADAVSTAAAVRAGDVSAADVVAAAIARIEEADHAYSFMVSERFERALEEAGEVDPRLPLAGVPVLTKDYLATVAGQPLTECSNFVPGWVPEEDCEYVARLKQAGAIVLGSVTTSEFAVLSCCEPHRYGVTVNPNAPDRTCGGSSGGSAVAVASGAVPVAHGSDVGGSIRMPAACCGVIGLKPTRGRNPLGPAFGDLCAGTWAEHVLSRSVRDSAAFLDATSGPAPGDPYQAPLPHRSFQEAAAQEPRRMRILVSPELPSGRALHPDSAAGLEKTAALLEELGHEVDEGNPEFDLAGAEPEFWTVVSAGLAARIAMWSERLGREPAEDDLEPMTWYMVERGRTCSGSELMAAITKVQLTSREIARFYETADVWLSPTVGIPPFPLGYLDAGPDLSIEEVVERDCVFGAFTWLSNITGQPALSYPAHRTEDGVPIGIQLTGRFGEDNSVLGLAAALERHRLGG